MTSIRYIITRSCLQDGSMRLLKYNEGHFPQSGPAQFVDEKGTEHPVHIDRERMRVTGLRTFYHDLNLGVNDVMLLTPAQPGRYQVDVIVKPHPIVPATRPAAAPAPEARRVVVSSTPHVREVRLQHAPATPVPPVPARQAERTDSTTDSTEKTGKPAESQHEVAALFKPAPPATTPAMAVQASQPQLPARPQPAREQAAPASSAPQGQRRAEEQVAEFARLTGYTLEYPATGLMRLKADLGPQYGYSVLLAADPLAMTQPAWEDAKDEARLLMTHESERPGDLHRLTREALGVLIDHAHLAPLSPVDLRGYWRAGSIDLESAASITELVSAHLAQRGTFTFVLLSLAQQEANSIVSVPRLAERLGSGVNTAELGTILETLSRPPFLALTPLPGGQYLLRTDVDHLLSDLSEYAHGVRRRTVTPAVTPAAQSEAAAVHAARVHA
ncbi:hypothetical protein ACFOPQ_18180 [Deinococcus antarcticus]|uniref:Uncharacterized protein n=1 Tax=Deinococcus antarcticus TaxID=1298767 RepID=A0ABV8AEL5_9DEIO